MRSPLLAAVLAVTILPSVLAASALAQDGQCRYTGDWRTFASSTADPTLRFGPPLHPYADVGACASAFAEDTPDGRTRIVLRADVVDTVGAFVVKYRQGKSSGEFACGTTAWCEVGPLESTHWSSSTPTHCGRIEVWKDGALLRAASACA